MFTAHQNTLLCYRTQSDKNNWLKIKYNILPDTHSDAVGREIKKCEVFHILKICNKNVHRQNIQNWTRCHTRVATIYHYVTTIMNNHWTYLRDRNISLLSDSWIIRTKLTAHTCTYQFWYLWLSFLAGVTTTFLLNFQSQASCRHDPDTIETQLQR